MEKYTTEQRTEKINFPIYTMAISFSISNRARFFKENDYANNYRS